MRATVERAVRAKRLDDGRTYTLAQLISYSVNDPKKMPRFDKVFPDAGQTKKPQTADEIHALMVSWVAMAEAMTEGQNG